MVAWHPVHEGPVQDGGTREAGDCRNVKHVRDTANQW